MVKEIVKEAKKAKPLLKYASKKAKPLAKKSVKKIVRKAKKAIRKVMNSADMILTVPVKHVTS